ncbi:hypothetical protein MKX07_003554 [Trichoderma sp. CBMAI-0711]|nr:hypothetical protein MKX07_003554 [Trichoderma sp. CBMAI-0711]
MRVPDGQANGQAAKVPDKDGIWGERGGKGAGQLKWHHAIPSAAADGSSCSSAELPGRREGRSSSWGQLNGPIALGGSINRRSISSIMSQDGSAAILYGHVHFAILVAHSKKATYAIGTNAMGISTAVLGQWVGFASDQPFLGYGTGSHRKESNRGANGKRSLLQDGHLEVTRLRKLGGLLGSLTSYVETCSGGQPEASKWRSRGVPISKFGDNTEVDANDLEADNCTLAASESEPSPESFTLSHREPAPQNWDSLFSPQLLQGWISTYSSVAFFVGLRKGEASSCSFVDNPSSDDSWHDAAAPMTLLDRRLTCISTVHGHQDYFALNEHPERTEYGNLLQTAFFEFEQMASEALGEADTSSASNAPSDKATAAAALPVNDNGANDQQAHASESQADANGQQQSNGGDKDSSGSAASQRLSAQKANVVLCGVCGSNPGKYKCSRCRLP